MNRNKPHPAGSTRLTFGDLVATVSELARNERLAAAIVADMINSRMVRLEGKLSGKRVVLR